MHSISVFDIDARPAVRRSGTTAVSPKAKEGVPKRSGHLVKMMGASPLNEEAMKEWVDEY
ncbi:hypothetical protein QT235_17250 [Geobacillus stearothermophilus]|nr:hypothetical protein QT235_17250 [Geobacillus stearothermophilus]